MSSKQSFEAPTFEQLQDNIYAQCASSGDYGHNRPASLGDRQSPLAESLSALSEWLRRNATPDDPALHKNFAIALADLTSLRELVESRAKRSQASHEQLERVDAALAGMTRMFTSLPTAFAKPGWAANDIGRGTTGLSRRIYISVRAKFAISLLCAAGWMSLSIWLSLPWLRDLSRLIGEPLAVFLVSFVAYVPGFMNAFLVASLLLDRRPPRARFAQQPGITVLVPCYNETAAVAETILSLAHQEYSGDLEFLIIDDGSTDLTASIARRVIGGLPEKAKSLFRVITHSGNAGKAAVLNRGLAMARHKLVATVDADSWLLPNGLQRIAERYLSDPPNTRAVAGAIFVRNSRENWITRAQEWDYFHGIAGVKRMQSMYHGTLVAQGAFSLYDAETLREVGGWPECVGEDIVLSWAILKAGHRIGHCEDALMFTNVPETFSQFANQRKRWSRGLIEAFMRHGSLLWAPRMTTLFIWWNLLFLPMDIAYTFGFIPGIILALFGYYYVVGAMTLALLPLAGLCNGVLLMIQRRMFKRQDLHIRRNVLGFLFYVLGYSFVVQPVSIWGYASELLGLRKSWGTK